MNQMKWKAIIETQTDIYKVIKFLTLD